MTNHGTDLYFDSLDVLVLQKTLRENKVNLVLICQNKSHTSHLLSVCVRVDLIVRCDIWLCVHVFDLPSFVLEGC